MFNFGPSYLANAQEVEERFVRQYLLPLLGYTPATWSDEVLVGSRSGFQRFTARLSPFSSTGQTQYLLLIEAKSPKQRLDGYVSQLHQAMIAENVDHSLLVNGKELRVYRRSGWQIEPIFTCAGEEVAANTESLRALISRQVLMAAANEVDKRGHQSDAPNSTSPTTTGTLNAESTNTNATSATAFRVQHVASPSTPEHLTPEQSTPAQPFIASASGDQTRGNQPQPEEQRSATFAPSQPSTPDTERAAARPETVQPERKTDAMKVIAIYHNKGGVGKTTVTVNLAAALRNRGYRVLLIDLDSQANSTFATGLVKFQFDEDDNLRDNNVYHVLESGDFYSIPEVIRSSNLFHQPEINVLPSHISLIEGQYKLNQIKASQTRLIKKLRDVNDQYDFVLIDTPPSRDIYAQVAIIAANYLIIPSDLKPFANQGLTSVGNFIKEIDEFRESMGRPPIQVLGVLPSKMSTNKFAFEKAFPRQKEKITGHYGFPVMDTVIFERIGLSHAVNQTNAIGDLEIPDPKSIFVYAQNNPSAAQAAAEFDALAEEVLRKVA